MTEKVKVAETIVVEGRYDKNTLSQFLDANIIETGGFGIFNNSEILALIERLANKTGVIVLTDSDGAGFMIRGKIKGAVRSGRLLHAYIPNIAGKEKRKRHGSSEGTLGVEGMTAETILDALRSCGATIDDAALAPGTEKRTEITKADMYELGLMGTSDSAERRNELKRRLRLPEKLSTNALCDVLNVLYTRDEFLDMCSGACSEGTDLE